MSYSQPNPEFPQYPPPYPGPQRTTDTTGLVMGILVTLFCCLPFGIVSIVMAAKGNGPAARMWAGIGAGIGLIVIVIYAIVVVGNRN